MLSSRWLKKLSPIISTHFRNLSKQILLDGILKSVVSKQQETTISIGLALRLVRECAKRQDLQVCRVLQRLLIGNGLNCLSVLADHIIRLFASCGSLVEANFAFSHVAKASNYTYNAVIDAHGKLGSGELGLVLYNIMQQEDKRPDTFTLLGLLRACGDMCSIEQGRFVHDQIILAGLPHDIVVGSALVDIYIKCGGLEEAWLVLKKLPRRNVVSWSALIFGYAHHAESVLALECYEDMLEEGIEPNNVTFLGILKAYTSLGTLHQVRKTHEQMIQSGIQCDIIVGSTLIDTYAKCLSLEEACKIFDNLPRRNVVSWSAMIAGYAQHGEGSDALRCFGGMLHQGIKPNKVTFLNIMKACGRIGAIGQGRHIHEQIIQDKIQSDIVVSSSLVDMYSNCGNVKEAFRVFDSLQTRNLVSWNAMIAGYAQLGDAGSTTWCFDSMLCSGIRSDDISFIGILTACSHAGLVDEGLWYFKTMRDYHRMQAGILHTNCMVDLLGRAGSFKEAVNLLEDSAQPGICLWRSLLSSCKSHMNVELGRQCFDAIVCLDPLCSTAYILMSSIYSNFQMWMDAHKVLRKYPESEQKTKGICSGPSK